MIYKDYKLSKLKLSIIYTLENKRTYEDLGVLYEKQDSNRIKLPLEK